MKARLGMVVSSEWGTGPIVAMSKEWCIQLAGHYPPSSEFCVRWDKVWFEVLRPEPPDAPASTLQEGPEVEG